MTSILSPSDNFWEIPMDVPWGDIVPPSEDTGPLGVGWSVEVSTEKDALQGWVAPSLRLRKNIWENFPVSLVPICDGDGTDRYAIVWHERNLNQWRHEKSESHCEWMDYDEFCVIRLMYALSLNANRYVVEEARTDDQICVIAMVHDGDSACQDEARTICTVSTASVSVSASASSSEAPRTLKGIASMFPVVWEQKDNVLFLKFHNKKLRDSGETKAQVAARLVKALKESPAGTYSPAPKGSIDVICLFTLVK